MPARKPSARRSAPNASFGRAMLDQLRGRKAQPKPTGIQGLVASLLGGRGRR